MTRYTDDEREISRGVNFGMGQGTKIALWILALVIAIGGLFWVVRIVTSEPRGQGEAFSQQRSAENRIRAEAEFNKRYASVKTLDKNVTQAAIALKRTPDDTRRQIEYDGNVRNCNEAVNNYNAFSQSYLNETFRPIDLPVTIDEADPSTNCLEN